MKHRTWLALFACMFLGSATVMAQSAREQDRPLNPTVTGGTGLFTVYDASTLKRGEFNIAAYYNNFDREPGNVDISQQIVSGAVGLTDRLEFFAASVFRQQLVANQRREISGFFLPNVRFPGTLAGPVPLGPGSSAGAPFVGLIGPSTTNISNAGAAVGGVLPGLVQSGTRIVGTGANQRLIGNLPGYLNDFPFLASSEYTSGNTTLGAKFRFTDPENPLGLAIVGFVNIPTSFANGIFRGTGNGVVRGGGPGAVDYGVILVPAVRAGRFTFTGNLGAVKTGDPSANNIRYLDRRNIFIASGAVDVAVNKYFQAIGEITSNIYYGSGTPNLNPVNPLDLTVGARFTPTGNDKSVHFSFGGGYRRLLNNANSERGSNRGDVNGFVVNAVIGYRRRVQTVEAPDPCANNRPPTVTLSSDRTRLKTTERARLTAVASDPDPYDTNLTYNWTASVGRIEGTGPNVTYVPPTDRAGTTTVTVTVSDLCCATATASLELTIEKNTCPTVTVMASPTQVKEGSDAPISLSAVGRDADDDPLTYRWTTSAGRIQGSGANVTLDTTGLSAGRVVVTVTVDDGKCTGEASTAIEILSPPPPPQAYTIACDGTLANPPFRRNVVRVDNQCKALLDQIVTRLQSDPTAQVIVDGHADKGEKRGTARKRADNVRAYLVGKGVDPNRIELRIFDDQRAAEAPGGNNRRVVVTVVPEGAQRPE
ncbi:OmpA family protein [Chloracidobacterium sp. MS 40/45]|uniref:OmpA family protein n=1 Tax=Chloracidobacterium aggregatum TaxID=2851959 RepID=UPI001B8D72BD|nr:OmpA family protein [Chloracidobacterium aggregatum]QUW01684.1 OmpA family protein [Chloracidobacterium sp. MS 40/45]